MRGADCLKSEEIHLYDCDPLRIHVFQAEALVWLNMESIKSDFSNPVVLQEIII
jgi:hypothetical protein